MPALDAVAPILAFPFFVFYFFVLFLVLDFHGIPTDFLLGFAIPDLRNEIPLAGWDGKRRRANDASLNETQPDTV